jgi:hypothetical protein
LNNILTRLCYAICAVLLLLQAGCRNPTISNTGNLNFQQVNLGHIDTLTVRFNTIPDRPLIASAVSTGVLASMNDLFFGRTYAGIYAQVLLGFNDPTFANTVIDSAVLSMPFVSDSSYYGRCNKPMNIVVYEVSQNMTPGDNYFSNDAFGVYGQPIGQLNNYVPNLADSVYLVYPLIDPYVPTQNQAPQMRVRLSNAFANKLLNTPDSILLSSLSFIYYVKGIYITTNPSTTGNGAVYFGLNNCAINLYYHHPAYSPIDTQVFQYTISTYGVTVNHFDHYYGGTLVQHALSNPNPAGDKVGYIQAGGGTRLKLTIPFMKNIDSVPGANGRRVPIGVTKAELILPIMDTLLSDPSYHPPLTLIITRIDDIDSVEQFNANNNGGIGYLTTRLDNNGRSFVCYVFNLTEYVQRVFNGYYSNNNGYYVGYSYTVVADRTVILNNPAQLSTQCKLNITYTLLQ